jgi:divalent metal cation (Fe/Co/Zn/Cd) transporter
MRSIAVLVAALLAMVVKSITAEEADAAAAVIVSFVIMLTVLPLVRGICANIVELWHIRQEEQADLVLSSSQTLQQKA